MFSSRDTLNYSNTICAEKLLVFSGRSGLESNQIFKTAGLKKRLGEILSKFGM